ncbi:radial spoke head 10 homolog B-like [Pieris brassicae]|uniref:radial spoke head 10 homolog B-like n=1 Tax=Pieris brassicae TaxID=7116 RepID=UPI001E65FC31|nr:radial spoke head 10 homolog B-like [Pieris brassicae]
MYYVDSQKTLTRRESSLVVEKDETKSEYEALSTARGQSTARLVSESGASLIARQRGYVQRELVTVLFESMLDHIVESWSVIEPPKPEEGPTEFPRTASELTLPGKKKKAMSGKPSKNKRSQSKIDMDNTQQETALPQSHWSCPDERAIIKFRNGNLYEGSISMKCMHGEGRFQWADGTVYLGQFKDNEIRGKGFIQWKDDTWYEGHFVGNLRHGAGLYVDSRKQRSYAGGWFSGTKHGFGAIYYSGSFKNSYNGEWVSNVRHGFGSREYCALSGYKGYWDYYVREGKGLMIWPNHDFYRGEWKNGVMSGYGIYIWDSYYNNAMSLPSITAYRGNWEKGQRHGYGILNLGFGLGSYYKGEFKNNNKHGPGTFITNNGLILQDKMLFIDDNFGPLNSNQDYNNYTLECKRSQTQEPFEFDICDQYIGLFYHIEQALKELDKDQEARDVLIREFYENNKILGSISLQKNENNIDNEIDFKFEEFLKFEETSLRKALQCYEIQLKQIYYKYATICNEEEIYYTPILIRLYLWQLYYDCNIHEKNLTLVEIDNIFHANPEWLARSPHNPFEKIYFWQFLHGLISIARKLYAKRHLPEKRPDTILASAFRKFMDNDVLPGVGRKKGFLTSGYGLFVPLTGTYNLYRCLGEPCTVRDFLCAMKRPQHCTDLLHPILRDDEVLLGRNAYVFGDELTFIAEFAQLEDNTQEDLKLFNIGNLSSKAVILFFSSIFPQILKNDKIMSLDVQLTFFEFYQGLIACVEESIRLKNEELKCQEKSTTSIPIDNFPKLK